MFVGPAEPVVRGCRSNDDDRNDVRNGGDRREQRGSERQPCQLHGPGRHGDGLLRKPLSNLVFDRLNGEPRVSQTAGHSNLEEPVGVVMTARPGNGGYGVFSTGSSDHGGRG
jgi:hypothetical protein